MAQAGRPLSPHLQVYRWYLTMGTSIGHRVTGSALAVGLLLLTWWLVALATGPDSFATVRAVTNNPLGGLVLFGYTFIIFFHCLNGIRHLVWDTGHALSKEVAYQSGLLIIGLAGAITVIVWLIMLLIG
jgi:succinate dehydrogenase / fumarate reductase, cytochrome b subunit